MIVQEYEVIVQAHTAHWDQVKKENPEFDFLFGTLTINNSKDQKDCSVAGAFVLP